MSKQPKKITAAERDQRVSEIMGLLLEGQSRAAVLQYASKKEWGVQPRSVDSYIARATAALEAEATIDRAAEFAKAKARLERLYGVAMARDDLGNARLILAELHKLLSLYMPPAPQTLRLLGIDMTQLEDVVKALHNAGHDPAAVFNELISQAAKSVKAGTDHE